MTTKPVTPGAPANKQELQTAKPELLVNKVSNQVAVMISSGRLHIPPHYSPTNALKSLWLILQTAQTADKQPVLSACTQASIANTMLDTVIQGLDPSKDQMYPIAYGRTLTCQRSYHGDQAIAKRVNPEIDDFIAMPVYEGDEFKYRISSRGYEILAHEQSLSNIHSDKIVAAYCIAVRADGSPIRAEIMTYDQLLGAWKKSKAKVVLPDGSLKDDSFYADFTDEAARKTVIHRLCKRIISSSNDKSLMIETFKRTADGIATEAEANANMLMLESAPTSSAMISPDSYVNDTPAETGLPVDGAPVNLDAEPPEYPSPHTHTNPVKGVTAPKLAF